MTLPATGEPGALYVELRKASDDYPLALMSLIDFRRDFGGCATDGVVAVVSALGFDGRRVDLGPLGEVRAQLAADTAADFTRSKVAGR